MKNKKIFLLLLVTCGFVITPIKSKLVSLHGLKNQKTGQEVFFGGLVNAGSLNEKQDHPAYFDAFWNIVKKQNKQKKTEPKIKLFIEVPLEFLDDAKQALDWGGLFECQLILGFNVANDKMDRGKKNDAGRFEIYAADDRRQGGDGDLARLQSILEKKSHGGMFPRKARGYRVPEKHLALNIITEIFASFEEEVALSKGTKLLSNQKSEFFKVYQAVSRIKKLIAEKDTLEKEIFEEDKVSFSNDEAKDIVNGIINELGSMIFCTYVLRSIREEYQTTMALFLHTNVLQVMTMVREIGGLSGDKCGWEMTLSEGSFKPIAANTESETKARAVSPLVFKKFLNQASKSGTCAHACFNCGKEKAKFLCPLCSHTRFCSGACQRQGWSQHMQTCSKKTKSKSKLKSKKKNSGKKTKKRSRKK